MNFVLFLELTGLMDLLVFGFAWRKSYGGWLLTCSPPPDTSAQFELLLVLPGIGSALWTLKDCCRVAFAFFFLCLHQDGPGLQTKGRFPDRSSGSFFVSIDGTWRVDKFISRNLY